MAEFLGVIVHEELCGLRTTESERRGGVDESLLRLLL